VKLKSSLSLKIWLLALLNVALLAMVFSIFAATQFRLNLSSFLFAPARDRMLSVSRYLALQLPELPQGEWSGRLENIGKTYGVRLYLFNDHAEQLAGPAVELPERMMRNLQRRFYDSPAPPPKEEANRPPPQLDGRPPLWTTRSGTPEEYWVAVPIPIRTGARGRPMHGDLVWRFPSLWRNPFLFDYRPWLVVILAIIGISVVCWLPLVRGLTRTISQMTRATSQIAEGRFEVSLSTNRRDELGHLSRSINRMAGRLSDLLNGQRRFLSDIAHELCSPVARMQAAVAILEQRSIERTRAYVGDVAEELNHISELINELLSFSKAEFASGDMPLGPVEVAEVARNVSAREGSDLVPIELRIPAGLAVEARSDLLDRALANLVRNAIRYAGDGGPIVIAANAVKDGIVISVADQGPGLPEEELENVFKPFYRPELARQRETGGTGLGLAIVRKCIEACGGRVTCHNRSPHGLIVEIFLRPAQTPASQPATVSFG
jgi:two-component system sensor histidine kinase CpxA